MSDYYEVLGVTRGASADEIKKAYRKKARALHPDVAGPGHEDEFKLVSTAYETLSDPGKRELYDLGGEDAVRGGGAGFGGGDFGGFADIFSSFFGAAAGSRGPASRARRGQDALLSVDVELEEVAFGATRTVPFDTHITCPACEGSCCAPGTSPVTCSSCNGSGSVQHMARSFLGNVMTTSPCTTCHGYGTVIVTPCPECSGEGRKRTHQDIEIRIPAGVSTGTRMRMSGRGEAGPAGGPAGDLYVEFHEVEHENLRREGDDLRTELRIPMTAAALGAEFDISTLDGDQRVVIKPGTQPGEVLPLKGLGVGRLRRAGRGDLNVEIVVETPTRLDERQRDLLRRLAELRGEEGGLSHRDDSVMGRLKERLSGR
ncbi:MULTISPECIES: molecular chaperone DnaJ [Actinomyces]|uniref:Chaperone protein DnaJ n=1 Tax=Actinomyces marmotae TaxID=2737173 RepID=A0A6M8B9L6_9ACTO|nr:MULTISPECIES: molecular chaperone DnaJ [Actinomyces]QKD79585.1 molecular chaperone DnaJ [Actinomyces marmotae]